MIKTIKRYTLFLFKREIKTVNIILLSVVISLSVLFILFSILYNELDAYQTLSLDRRTYTVNFYPKENSGATSFSNFCELLQGERFPKPEEYGLPISLSEYTQTSGSRQNIAAGNADSNAEFVRDWQPVFTEQDLNTLNYTFTVPEILEGRWFTEKEVTEGSYCVVLDSLEKENFSVGDFMDVFGLQLEIIGFAEHHEFAANNFLPFVFLNQKEVDKTCIGMNSNTIVFEHEIAEEDMDFFSGIMRTVPWRAYELNYDSYIYTSILYIVIIGISMTVVACNLYSCHLRLVAKNFTVYKIVYFCGGTKRMLYWGLLLPSLIIITFSYILSSVLYSILSGVLLPDICKVLTPAQFLIPFLFLLIFCACSVGRAISKYLRKERIL